MAGMDHWYTARAVAEQVQQSRRAEFVALAHRDAEQAREAAAQYGAASWGTDYRAVVERDDIDLVICTGPTAGNADLVIAAARRGKHSMSVKPMAMTLEEADRIVAAVEGAGVLCFPFESQLRLSPLYQQVRRLIQDGRLGRPLSGLYVLRGSVPTQDWPGRQAPGGRTWWQDPQQVPGGGWIDHAIYTVDALRWLLGAEVRRVSGLAAKLKHPHLEMEDYGVALLEFTTGFVATVEVTWHGGPHSGYTLFQITGTDGQLSYDGSLLGKLAVSSAAATLPGWTLQALPARGANVFEHLLDCILEGQPPAATVRDGRQNVAACLAFYEAARQGRAVEVR